MTMLIIAVIVILGVFFFIAMNKGNEQKPSQETNNSTPIKSSYLLSSHEKTMFGELRQAVPECQIFVQVALSAILWTKSQATRNRFNRLVADFVITDQKFNILAVIELDDKSHDNKQEKDAQRDAMLREAGYKVLRYRHMPSKEKLRADILS